MTTTTTKKHSINRRRRHFEGAHICTQSSSPDNLWHKHSWPTWADTHWINELRTSVLLFPLFLCWLLLSLAANRCREYCNNSLPLALANVNNCQINSLTKCNMLPFNTFRPISDGIVRVCNVLHCTRIPTQTKLCKLHTLSPESSWFNVNGVGMGTWDTAETSWNWQLCYQLDCDLN